MSTNTPGAVQVIEEDGWSFAVQRIAGVWLVRDHEGQWVGSTPYDDLILALASAYVHNVLEPRAEEEMGHA